MGQVGRPRDLDKTITVRSPDGTERTAQRDDIIIDALRQGASMANAARLAGIAPTTLNEWVARGEGRDTDRSQDDQFARFAERVTLARAEGERTFTRSLLLAAVPRQVATTKTGYREALTKDGEVVRLQINETTTREEFSVEAVKFALTHQYGWKAVSGLEVSGPDGGPVNLREEAGRLRGELEAFLAGYREGQAEPVPVEVVDVPAIESES